MPEEIVRVERINWFDCDTYVDAYVDSRAKDVMIIRNNNTMIGNVGARVDHGGEAGLELVAVQEAVAVGVEAAKHLVD